MCDTACDCPLLGGAGLRCGQDAGGGRLLRHGAASQAPRRASRAKPRPAARPRTDCACAPGQGDDARPLLAAACGRKELWLGLARGRLLGVLGCSTHRGATCARRRRVAPEPLTPPCNLVSLRSRGRRPYTRYLQCCSAASSAIWRTSRRAGSTSGQTRSSWGWAWPCCSSSWCSLPHRTAGSRRSREPLRMAAERAVERAAVRAAGVMAAAARVAAVMVEVVPLWSKTAARFCRPSAAVLDGQDRFGVAVQVQPSPRPSQRVTRKSAFLQECIHTRRDQLSYHVSECTNQRTSPNHIRT